MLSILCYGQLPSSKVLYGVEQLRKAMNSMEIPLGEIQFVSTDAVVHRPFISLGIAEERVNELAIRLQAKSQEDLGREGYIIQNDSEGSDIRISIEADDDQGLLYGCLELSEQIEMGGIERVRAKIERAFVPFRGAKCNLPWEPYQEGYSTDINQETFLSILMHVHSPMKKWYRRLFSGSSSLPWQKPEVWMCICSHGTYISMRSLRMNEGSRYMAMIILPFVIICVRQLKSSLLSMTI